MLPRLRTSLTRQVGRLQHLARSNSLSTLPKLPPETSLPLRPSPSCPTLSPPRSLHSPHQPTTCLQLPLLLPQVGKRRRDLHWTHVLSIRRPRDPQVAGIPIRVVPQEFYGSPFLVHRPAGEIVPRDLALVPMRPRRVASPPPAAATDAVEASVAAVAVAPAPREEAAA